MRSWLEVDHEGLNHLVRTGEGRVTAVEPVGIPDSDGMFPLHRVEIDCVSPRGFARSIRFTARAQVLTHSELHSSAVDSMNLGEMIRWEIQWHRHTWVPSHVSIADLDLETDASARLISLESLTSGMSETVDQQKSDSR